MACLVGFSTTAGSSMMSTLCTMLRKLPIWKKLGDVYVKFGMHHHVLKVTSNLYVNFAVNAGLKHSLSG